MNFPIKDITISTAWNILGEGLLGYAIGYLESTSSKACASILVISTLAKTFFLCMATLALKRMDDIKLVTELTFYVVDLNTIMLLQRRELISLNTALLLVIGRFARDIFIKYI